MTDLIEKASQEGYDQYMEGLIGCCEPSWGELPDAHKRRLMHANKMAIATVLREMMEPTDGLRDAVHTAMMQWYFDDPVEAFYATNAAFRLLPKAFANTHGIQIGVDDGED